MDRIPGPVWRSLLGGQEICEDFLVVEVYVQVLISEFLAIDRLAKGILH